MPRAKVEQLPLSSELRPVASLVDTYEKPAQSPLRDLAASLGTVDQSLQTLLQVRDQKQEQDDLIRGRAAFYSDSQGEFAKAVTEGKIPAQYSPFYVRGFKNAQGAAAGEQLRTKWQDAWDNWDGKDSGDPEAFNKFFHEFVKQNVGTEDPDVLRGVLPTVEELQQSATTQYTQYQHDKTVQGSLTAHGALISGAVQSGLDDGLTQEKGADYKTIFGNVNKVVGESLAKGDPDGKAVNTFIDVMSAKILETKDPKLMDWFNEKVPGQDYTYGQTPHGIEVKNATMNGLEALAAKQAAGMQAAEKRQMEKLKDEAQSGIINGIIADPNAPIDEKLLTQAEKNGDPTIRVRVKEWKETLTKGSSDQNALMHFYDDILSGRKSPKKALDDALQAGVFGTPEDLKSAGSFVQSFQTNQDTIQKTLDGQVSKQILEVLRQRTVGVDPTTMNPMLGTSDEGLEASSDFRQLVTRWITDNPNATQSEIEEQVSKFGKQVIERIKPPEDISQGGSYDRNPDLSFGNPYSQQPQGTPSGDAPPTDQQGGLSQDPEVQQWEKANNVTPEQRDTIKAQAEKQGMGYDEFIRQRALGGGASDPLKKISYNPNDTDTGDGDTSGIGLTAEQASSYIDQAFSQASEGSGKESSSTLLNLIADGESGGNYNAVYGRANSQHDLGQYSVDDILAHQQYARRHGAASTAIGRYQIIYKTLRGLKAELGLSGSEKFTPELQDKLGMALLNRRGMQAYRDGRISKKTFALSLSKEWASLPNPNTGRSFYAGDGLNRSRIRPSAVYAALGFPQAI